MKKYCHLFILTIEIVQYLIVFFVTPRKHYLDSNSLGFENYIFFLHLHTNFIMMMAFKTDIVMCIGGDPT